MKHLIVTILTLTLSSLYAQQFSNIIIASGGKFEQSSPYKDKATIGAYNPINKQYWIFDTINVESVQDIVVDGNFAYLAASDSILKYDLTTYTKVAQTYFAGIRSLTINGNNLFAGRFFGTGSFLEIFDKNTLTSIFSVPEIDATVYGVAVIGDSAYIPYNQKGRIDQFSPYGVYNDTLGKIAVVDMINQTFVHDILLDTTGVGVKQIYTYGNQIYAICTNKGTIANYNPINGTTTFNTIGAVKGITQIDSLIYLNYTTGTGTYDVKNNQIVNNSIINATFSIAEAIDTLGNKFYLTATDFSTYGNSFIYDFTGSVTDSFSVNISPEAMDVFYFNTNLAPIALNDTLTITQDAATITKAVLLNDFDANADNLTLTILTNTTHGIAVISGTDIAYTVTTGYVGVDSVQYKICDASVCDSAWINITVNALNGISFTEKKTVSIYPNPTNGMLNLVGTFNKNTPYTITTINGQIIISGKNITPSPIDLSALKAGVYFIHLLHKNSVDTFKIIKI